MLNLPSRVQVTEVGPRDGLQRFKQPVDTATKVRMVDRFSEAGLPVIEVTGFAHSGAIPNLADAQEVFARIKRKPGVVYRGLVPNARGAERAAAAKVDEILSWGRPMELMGVCTGVDPKAVLAAAMDMAAMLNIAPRSNSVNGLTRERFSAQPSHSDGCLHDQAS